MTPLLLSAAFGAGFIVRLAGLPPLVGYLIAGFILQAAGASADPLLARISDLGIMLLLFTIGLKLKIRNIARPEIIGGASLHIVLMSTFFGLFIYILGFSGMSLLESISWQTCIIIGFALSFSSTVFAVKVLEEKGEMNSLHGFVSIGILIVQDIFAVVFLVAGTGKIPSPKALLVLPALFLLRPLFIFMLKKAGHGEVLVLLGLFLALVPGAEFFKAVGLKEDLGALVIGMLLAGDFRAKELADSLLRFKDIFLIGFFLSIGLSGPLDLNIAVLAVILALGINIKVFLYFVVLTRFKLRARTSFHASMALANFSEFGLIVTAFCVSRGWCSPSWLVIAALALAVSFVISAPLNTNAHAIYARVKKWLQFFETENRLAYDKTFDIGEAEILIFGMGHLGTSTYDQLRSKYGQSVLAIDYNEEKVKKHREQGRNVIHDDATDSEFWERITEKPLDQVKLVMLCMNDHRSNLYALASLRGINYAGQTAATAKFDDEVNELKQKGIDSAYNLYSEAGIGFADQVCLTLNSCGIYLPAEHLDEYKKKE